MRSSLKFVKDAKRQLIHASQGGGGKVGEKSMFT